jgi:brefeldin A-inhibited guanine nucleotide-exchange protein
MEKFAERYYLQNRDTFASADMAFILAFSTIMLQTNLHNPAIKEEKKMTKDQFLKQNKGISSDGELPEQMLMDIYDRIAAEPISITSGNEKKAPPVDKQAASGFFQPSADKKKKDAFSYERKEMVKAGEALFKLRASRRKSTFVRSQAQAQSDDMYTRPMFEVVWAPVLGVISQILEVYDEPETVEMCLLCFEYAIRLASRLDVPMARRTYINTLAKFTTLDSVREMKQKNVDSIRALLEVSLIEGDFLEESWSQVLQTISQLARLQLFGNGLHTDDMFFSDAASETSEGGSRSARRYSKEANGGNGFGFDTFAKLFAGPSKAETVRIVEEGNAELVMREIEPALIDQVFLNTVSMSEESVLHFVRSLCEVSMLEIAASSTMNSFRGKDGGGDTANPRVFSLQKLVEVADYNMGSRGRIAWASIWNLLASHFTNIGAHDNFALAMYAIDSLKQLSTKFLQKEELSNFNFQRLFLKPFEIIMSRSKSAEIKDLVLRVLSIMIQTCAANIRSGWKSIFVIFEVAAGQESTEIANIAFEITERLMTQQFQLLIYDFVELQNCLVAFVGSSHTALSLRALAHLAKCADHLADGSISPALESTGAVSDPSASNGQAQISEDASVFRLWFPLLLGLSTRVADSRLTVRMRALETLGQVLRTYGNLFSPQTWAVIFKGILFPMIDSAQIDSTAQPFSSYPTENVQIPANNGSWIGTMAYAVFNMCAEMYQLFKEKADEVNLLPELMAMLEDCILIDTESLARLGVSVYRDLILSLGGTPGTDTYRIDDVTADLVCAHVSKAILGSLCLDYGDVGQLEFADSAPSSVAELVLECPIAARRRVKERRDSDVPVTPRSMSIAFKTSNGNVTVGSTVNTPFADGIFVDTMPPIAALGVSSRSCVQLDWGATLYTHEPLIASNRAASTESAASQLQAIKAVGSPSQTARAWAQLSSASMTSMVVSLDFIRLSGDVLNTYFANWHLKHLSQVLTALEASHWHARSFNENASLRKALYEKGFMRFPEGPERLPHLLEQEIQTASLILDLVLRMYSPKQKKDVVHFAERWTER